MATKPTTGYDIAGNVDNTMPAGAKSLSVQDDNMKSMAEKLGQGYNATTGQMIDINKGVLEQLPEGNQAQRDANVTTRANAVASSLGQTYNADTQQYEAGPTALEIQRNKEQAAFNARNPVGTKTEDIKYTPPEQIQPSTAPTTPVQDTKATTTTQKVDSPVKTQKNTSGQTNVPEVDYNSSVGREDQIGNNLATITQQTPALLTDRAQYDKAFGYATADEGKKALLDGFFTNGKKTIDNINTIKQYANASVNDIGASLLDGSISSSVYGALLSDPTMAERVKKAEELNRIAGKKKDIVGAGEKQTTEVLAALPTIASAMENNELSGEEINAITSTPEQVALKKKKDAQWEELSKKQTVWDSIENDINTKYAGSRATASDKAQMVANARKLLLPELNRAERNYNNTITQLTDLKKEALGVLETNLVLYKEKKAKEDAILTEERQQKNALALDQAKFEQNIKQQAQLASDPYTAISSVMDEYKKMGVPFTQSIATKVNDAKAFIKDGGTIGGYVDKMIGDIQNKPEYMAIQAKAQNDNVSFQKIGVNQDTGEDIMGWVNKSTQTATPFSGGGTTAFTGMDTDLRNSEYVQKYPNEASFKNNNPAGITWNANFDNGTGVAKALQDAGISFSKGTARPKSEGGNYVSFDNIGDGMKARQIVFGTTYGNKDLSQALQSWKEGSNRNAGTQQYADSIMKEAGINPNQSVTYNSLSQEQKDSLTLAQIKRESGGLYKVLTQTPAKQGLSTANQIFDTIFQNSGGASKVSGDEAKVMKRRSSEYASQGLSAQDALLKYKGLNLSKEVDGNIAQQYISIGDNLLEKKPNDYEGKVAKYLNAGDTNGLNIYVNGLADDKVKARYGNDSILSSTYKTGNDRTNKLVTLIENNKDKLGAFDGNVSNLILKFQDMPEYQQLKTILTMSQADTRKYFAGSAVTATELSALEDFIGGKTTMNPNNLVTMLKTIKEDRDNTYNSQRAGLVLPSSTTQETTNISTPSWQQFY